MGAGELKVEWPLQRLLHMLNQMHSKEKNEWKHARLSATDNKKEVGANDRDEILTWIAKLTVQFSFHPESFFLAASILDRFITQVKVVESCKRMDLSVSFMTFFQAQPKYLKCIAISCFYLASKICEEEDVIPCTSELVSDSECGCRVCDVLRMERIILEKLSWDLHASTSLDYLHIFHMLAFVHFTDLSIKLSLSRHLAVLTSHLMSAISCYEVARYPNPAISLALLSLHLEALTKDPRKWTLISRQLQSLAQIKTSDFMMCRELLKTRLSPKFCNRLAFLSKPPYLKPSAEFESYAAKQESHWACTSGVATKRKASSPTNSGDSPRKPHPKMCFVERSEGMEYCDSDETMTASESEMEVEECQPQPSGNSRRLTYAEIVKSGLSSSSIVSHNSDTSNMNSPSSYGAISCGFEASCGFLSPTQHHGPISSIRI